jgi:hypothetical protein
MKLGDFVADITKVLGIKECGGCAKRRAALNRLDLDQPLLDLAKGLKEALVNPPEAHGVQEEDDRSEEPR